MRVLLADDQAKVRSALRLLLKHQPGVSILEEAVDVTGLLDWVKAACPDLVLPDWELPGLEADGLLSTLRELCPHLAVIALSRRPEARQTALDAGVDAFVSKGDPPERLLAAVDDCRHRRHNDEFNMGMNGSTEKVFSAEKKRGMLCARSAHNIHSTLYASDCPFFRAVTTSFRR